MGESFYTTKPWLKVRAQALKRDSYQCLLCQSNVNGKGLARVDHYPHSRKERPDLALDVNNLRTLCTKCDNLQSHARGQRFGHKPVQGVNVEGFPEGWE